MKLSHRRKRDHKAKVRRHPWKVKEEVRIRRFRAWIRFKSKVFAYRHRAFVDGHRAACLVFKTYLQGEINFGECRELSKKAFLTAYDRVVNDRRFDQYFKDHRLAEWVTSSQARAVDLNRWERAFMAGIGLATLDFCESDKTKTAQDITAEKLAVVIAPTRKRKGGFWEQVKGKLTQWFGGGESNTQGL
ncbi:hypothetical protein OMA37_004388 [Vibrio fluvialis]|nr:hypothetical protein [Vibrio fluvialis]